LISNASDEILMIERISALKCKHDFIQLSILALEFDYDQNWLICFVVMATRITTKITRFRAHKKRRSHPTTVKKYETNSKQEESGFYQ
jgi:hypothetical protein